jgi:hypothetical protein
LFSLISYSSERVFEGHIYAEVSTLDGLPVIYTPVSEETISASGKSVAYAIYRGNLAQIVYDADLFSRLDNYAKFLIMEHERAHHYLGHSLASKIFEEQNRPLENMSLLYRKEQDADCAAGYKSKELFPNKNRKDVLETYKKIYEALIQEASVESFPEWVYSRADKTATCLEGVLLPYPDVINVN